MPSFQSSSPWCSVIIPTLNEAATLPATLEALGDVQGEGGLEVIVVDGGSEDSTLAVARSYGCSTLLGTRGRARQMNAGAMIAKGPFLWFLHADTIVPPNWESELRDAIDLGLPAAFRLRFDYQKRYSPLRLYGYLSRFDLQAFRFGDQSLLVASADFKSVGGFDEGMELLEDNDLIRRLKQHCGGFHLLGATVTTSARKYRKHGVVYTQLVFVGLYLAYRLGAKNDRLLGWYRRAFG
ncbi:hypothetical protein A3850_006340 [Lewinella sp. 4G2]|nr:hypothetical protein A3850_006340 [Lewinella sp. 4G2]